MGHKHHWAVLEEQSWIAPPLIPPNQFALDSAYSRAFPGSLSFFVHSEHGEQDINRSVFLNPIEQHRFEILTGFGGLPDEVIR